MLNVWWYLEKMLPLQAVYEKTMIEEPFNEYEIFEEEDGLTLKVESCSWRGIDIELQELHYVHGASSYLSQDALLRVRITSRCSLRDS